MKPISLSILVLFSCACLIASIFFNKNLDVPIIKVNKQNSALNFSNQFLKVGFAGYKRLLADVLWISTLLESDLEHYNKKDLNNWMFLRFFSISELDELFLQNYIFGSQYLSIIKDDIEGSIILFEKGLRHYPNNYQLIFNGAYTYAFERGNYKKALGLYIKLRPFPQRPPFLESLIAKLKFQESGDLEEAFKVLNEIYKNQPKDSILSTKISSDLYAIKATLDLECLNLGRSDCSLFDFYGERYIEDASGQFHSQTEFEPYKLHIRKKREPE